MERHEIAFALTDVSDELLLEAERPCRQATFIRYRIAAALVAVMLLISACTTVLAEVTWEIEDVQLRSEQVYVDYYQDYDEILDFERLTYSVPLKTVKLKADAYAAVQDLLMQEWSRWQEIGKITPDLGKEHFFYDSQADDRGFPEGEYPDLRNFEDVEALLGITLDVSDELRRYVRMKSDEGSFGVEILCGLTGPEVRQLVWDGGKVEPTRVVISFTLPEYYCGNGRVEGSVVIPLTDENAAEGFEIVCHSHENEGEIWQEVRGTVMIFGNDPLEGFEGWCDAAYSSDGIAYTLFARKSGLDPEKLFPKPTYDTAKEMLLPLLEDPK